jgi:small subunit ribosomal protein S7
MAKKYRGTAIYLKPDARFKSMLATKLINSVMKRGKKSTAERVFYTAMDSLQEKVKDQEPLKVLETAIENVRPLLEVRPRRVGGATYQVPMEVPRHRGTSLALRWILESARGRKGKPMAQKLAEELLDAFNKQGGAFTKRENTHKMAEANKAFAHFAW